jgi:hypothetical protein
MPTYSVEESFWRDWQHLTEAERELFLLARGRMVHDLKRGKQIRAGLRVKRVQKVSGVYEMTWAPDGRATFTFGRRSSQARFTWSGAISVVMRFWTILDAGN